MLLNLKNGLIVSIMVTLAACNPDADNGVNTDSNETDTSPPSIISTSNLDQVLLPNDPVTFGFSEPVAVATLKVTHDSEELSLFTVATTEDRTEITLTPTNRWLGGNRALAIQVEDDAGNVFTSETFNIKVNLTFENDQSPSFVFGELPDAGRSYYGNSFMDQNGIWLADYTDSALYLFNEIPEERNREPNDVITAIDFIDAETQAVLQKEMNGPQTPFVYQDQLFITQYDDDVVYVFDDIPSSDKLNFGIILGQPDFNIESTSSSCSAGQLASPEAVIAADQKLLVADGGNNRVLIWNTLPTASGTLPDIVLGQFDFESCESSDGDFGFSEPSGIWTDGTRLLVVDGGNNRVLGWHTFPSSNNQPADFVLGQADFASTECNRDLDVPDANTLCGNYEGIFSNGRQVFVADSDNNRVLIWNDWPTQNGVPADIVLGQPDFTTNSDEESEQDNRFHYVAGAFVFNDLLLVSDESNGVIIVYDGE